MHHSLAHRLLRGLLLALALAGITQGAQATLIVNSSATPLGGGVFHYEFSITNSGPVDVAIVSLNAPLGDPFIGPSLVWPSGFLALYDDVLGFVDFLEDTDLFAVGTTVSGFGLDAGVAPISSFFDVFVAIDINGGIIEGTVGGAVPEPMTVSLLALGTVLMRSRATQRRSHG